ncbi:phosphatidate cytidylyltransferase [Arvimicrobium flavum]|uniref:phosphatidate cytidylyltransferase n=1 Tax=Arvimicrobium flavum TaxID=3393320 RepID=UPI00237C4824|nr:phosphatidate cytidylyltransferase [Mesorhizobium shangrilense]
MTNAEPGRLPLSNLQLRVISSIILAVAVLAITWVGGFWFRLLAALIAMSIIYEWSTISRRTGSVAGKILAGALLGGCMLALVAGFSAETVILLVTASVVASFAFGLAGGDGRETAASLAYAGAAAISLAFLRDNDAGGLLAILYLFAVVWATDILAYFVGRAVGGPKLAPSISPGKTWSGALGGAAGGVLGGVLVALVAGAGNLPMLALVALLLSIVSQVGDLFESAVKRRHGAKDSGNIIPGHGGVMDRVDGLVAAAFGLYLIGAATGGLNHPAQSLFP